MSWSGLGEHFYGTVKEQCTKKGCGMGSAEACINETKEEWTTVKGVVGDYSDGGFVPKESTEDTFITHTKEGKIVYLAKGETLEDKLKEVKRANAREGQVGGDHYKKYSIQVWDIIDTYKLDFYSGNILKYILRDKNSKLEDLKKARHYLNKLIELNS